MILSGWLGSKHWLTIFIIRHTLCAYIQVIHPHISPRKGSKCSPWPQLSCTERWAVWCPPSWLCKTALGCCSAGMGRHNGTHTSPHPAQPTHPVMSNKTHTYNRTQTQRCQLINPFTAVMTSAKWFLYVWPPASIPTFHAHQTGINFSNSAGKQNFSERLFFKAVFTNSTNSLAGKGLKGKILSIIGGANAQVIHI